MNDIYREGYVPRVIMTLHLLDTIKDLEARISELQFITRNCPPHIREKRVMVANRLKSLEETKAKMLESLSVVNSPEYRY